MAMLSEKRIFYILKNDPLDFGNISKVEELIYMYVTV